jgi:hypothetical protein
MKPGLFDGPIIASLVFPKFLLQRMILPLGCRLAFRILGVVHSQSRCDCSLQPAFNSVIPQRPLGLRQAGGP